MLIVALAVSAESYSQDRKWIDFNQNGKMDVYEDPYAQLDKRVNDLLSQMTVTEKMSILNELAPAIPRLGVEKYYHGNEALHGIVRPGKFTVFPQAIGLASTWNPELINQVTTAASDEARARWNELGRGKLQKDKYSDLLTFWSPTVNMARDPRWGRTPETYGEDPYLASQLGIAFVKGLQGDDPKYLKVVSTPKHFVANNEEHNRFECPVTVSEQVLRNYYLPAFRALITEGKAQSIMTAYPSINGVPCSANHWLLNDVLRKEWGFKGYVVSDCSAVANIYHSHHYTETIEDAAAAAMKAGLDLECNGYCDKCFIYRDYLEAALDLGKVTEQDIDNAAYRVLEARFKLGMFDDPSLVPYTSIPADVVGCKLHQELALETARQSIVLLKNNGVLPFNAKKMKSIAVLGINAASCEFGDYSGTPLNDPVSPLQGIINEIGNQAKVYAMPWVGRLSQYEIIPADYFSHEENGKMRSGLKTEYFSDMEFRTSFSTVNESQIHFDPANQPPNKNIPAAPMSVRWSGQINPKVSGKYILGTSKQGDFKLMIDGKVVFEGCSDEMKNEEVKFDFVAGKTYKVVAEYKNEGASYCSLRWQIPGSSNKDPYLAEKKLAKKCDVAVVVLGINKSIEMEGRDRKSITLPEDQQLFIREIYKANPKTVLVLVAGSQLAIEWEQEHLPAIVNAWYPGEQGGTAIADVLFGKYNPAGRLPLTYYRSLEELPAFNDYEVTNGRTYMFSTNEPIYPFGYGLSYTAFKYSPARIDKPTLKIGETLQVKVDVKNTGRYEGDEVVQLYLKKLEPEEVRPIKQLKGFQRIHLQKDESKEVVFSLDRNALSYWNKANDFVVEPGDYEIQIGSSSADIRQKIRFTVGY